METSSIKKKKPAERKKVPSVGSYFVARLIEPTTWVGLFTIGASLATGGAAAWLNPQTLPMISAGIGLVFAKEGE